MGIGYLVCASLQAAFLGFYKSCPTVKLRPEEAVNIANNFATRVLGCREIPELEAKTVGKMGLKVRLATFCTCTHAHTHTHTHTHT